MKPASLILLTFALALPCSASYYEEWTVQAKVVKVHDKTMTDAIRKKRPDIHSGKASAGVRLKIITCAYKEGHGKEKRLKPGMETDVILTFDGSGKNAVKEGDTIKIHYAYSNSAVPPGHQPESTTWTLRPAP
jgi:hypothetical protein